MGRFVYAMSLPTRIALVALSAGLAREAASAQETPALPPPATLPADFTGTRPAPVPPPGGYPIQQVDREGIVDLLREGRFEELERLFGDLEEAASRDIRREDLLLSSYRSFFGSDQSIAGRLDEWVAAEPGSDAALLARAQFRYARLWEARDRGAPNAADSMRTVEMEAQGQAGIADALLAFRLDPRNLAVHSTLLDLLLPWGWSEVSEEVLDTALSRFPASYRLREQALLGASPSWGGSYERMQRLVDAAQRYVSANPRLATLRGAIALEEAAALRGQRRYVEALDKTEEARTPGPEWDFYYQRGRIYFSNRDYVRALAELDSAYALRPVSQSVLEYRGRSLVQIARRLAPPHQRASVLELAEADLLEAVAFNAPDSTRASVLEWASVMKVRCAQLPEDCFEAWTQDIVITDSWWKQALLFLISLPLTLYMVLAEGNRLLLLPGPLIAGLALLWSFREWRRQRYWTPRIIHVMAVLAFLTLVLINVDWVLSGGTMWVQRYVVIAVCTLVPYVMYLVMFGPRYLGRRRRREATEEGPLR